MSKSSWLRRQRAVPKHNVGCGMPCGKEFVVHWAQTPGNVETFCRFLQQGKRFGFAKVDSEVPRELWEKFEETPPLF